MDLSRIKEINSKLRKAHFLSQCAHESANFTVLTENLNYSSEGLLKIFPKYFDKALALSYARNPQKIANRVYAKRMGNGEEYTGEGYKFRGRGYIQLTGKSNYTEFSKYIGEDCVLNPDLVSVKYPLESAAFFFTKNNLWAICDEGDSEEVIKKLTKRINGGLHGIEDRIKKFKSYYI